MATGSKASRAAALAVEAAELAAEAAGGKSEGDADEAELGPLFAGLSGDKAERHEKTQIFRVEPIDEGHIGDLQPDCTQDDIRDRWGGGRFRAVAVDEKGAYIQRTTVRISGDPIFDNDIGRRTYERWLKQRFGKEDVQARERQAGELDPDEAKEARAEARHNRELARIKAEADAALLKVRAELDAKDAAEERRRAREREDREAAEERRREAAAEERRLDREERRIEREEREAAEDRRREAEREERRLEREGRADPMAQFAAMAQIVTAISGSGGGGADDPVTAIAARLPEILVEARETAAALAGSSGGRQQQQAQQRRRQVSGEGDEVKLEGPIATKALRAIERLKKLGHDPEAVLDRVFTSMGGATSAAKKLPPGKGSKAAAPARRPAPPARKAPPRSSSSRPNGARTHAPSRKSTPAPPTGSGNNPTGGTPS